MFGNHGGRRRGAGRPKGRRNALTIEQKRTITELAQDAAPGALAVLVEIANDPEASHSARVAAAGAVLDRAHGKPRQALEVEGLPGVVAGSVRVYLPHNGRDARPALEHEPAKLEADD